ncbi:MAG: helix-turn-helix transcriptional regulator [Bacteriovorax sp.]|nr:helix-turn-helix transcriptional regulator [Bacteriovorax sp.]
METIMGKVNLKVANLVRAEREKRGWTQLHLAEIASLSERTVQRFEKDGVGSKETLLALASSLDLDIEKLTEEEPPKKPDNVIRNFPLIMNGKEALDFVWHTDLHEFDYFDVEGDATKTIAAFFGFLNDAAGLSRDVEISDRVEWAESLSSLLNELSGHNLLAFGRRYKAKLGGNKIVEMMDVTGVTIYIVPFTHPGIGMEGDKCFLRVQVPTKNDVSF